MHKVETFQPHQNRIIMEAEKKDMNKLVLIRPPGLSSVLVPTPEGPVPLPIPPNGVELYGEEEVPEEAVVVAVPAVLFRKREPMLGILLTICIQTPQK